MTDLQRLADAMHSIRCHWNHTDMCGYDYESWEKPGSTRERWLKRAQGVIDRGIPVKVATEVVEAIKNISNI